MKKNNNVTPGMLAITFISSFCKGFATVYALRILIAEAKRRKEVRAAK